MIETETYDIVHGRITAKTLMGLGDNPLSLAIKVSPFKIFSFWKCVYSYKQKNRRECVWKIVKAPAI